MKYGILCCLFMAAANMGAAQRIQKPLVTAITPADLKKDMYEIAADKFRGREAGTLDELKAAAWLADKAKTTGMLPAGEEGTWFQFYEMYRHQIAENGTVVSIGDKQYTLLKDVLVTEITPANIDAPIVFLNNPDAATLAAADIKGKVVAIQVDGSDIKQDMFLFNRRYPGFIRNKYYKNVEQQGAAAIVFIADAQAEQSWDEVSYQLVRGQYGVEGLREKVVNTMPVFWLHGTELETVRKAGQRFKAVVHTVSYKYPSVNIVGMIPGTDPQLKKEYVLISGHHDHDGIRLAYGQDTVYNGADDNASTCVAMLAMARAFKKQPAKRSILFVFHGAEERGLLGSRWYAAYPTVPRNNIVAVLNGDMIGRNALDSATLLGAAPPHQNSVGLVAAALQANREGPAFKLDKEWDRPEHPEYFYFRSDHLPYARFGIPALFYTSMLHHQYHTPMDDADNIDYKKLYKMTEWMYRTAWIVGNAAKRPDLIPNVQLER